MEVLQTSALPLGDGALRTLTVPEKRPDSRGLASTTTSDGDGDHATNTLDLRKRVAAEWSQPRRAGGTKAASWGAGVPSDQKMERETGFEPATSTLARSHSTTELFPPCPAKRVYTKTGTPATDRHDRQKRTPQGCRRPNIRASSAVHFAALVLASPLRFDHPIRGAHRGEAVTMRDRLAVEEHGTRGTKKYESLQGQEHDSKIVDLPDKWQHVGNDVDRRNQIDERREWQRLHPDGNLGLAQQAPCEARVREERPQEARP